MVLDIPDNAASRAIFLLIEYPTTVLPWLNDLLIFMLDG